MLYEIAQIKKFLANKYNLPLENEDSVGLIRVVGYVPDGEHIIPLGVSEQPTRVEICDGVIHIK